MRSHLLYAFRHPRADYQDHMCPYYLGIGTRILGDELHIICQCPGTEVLLYRFTAKVQRLTRLLDLPFLHYLFGRRDHTTSTRNPPPQVLQKELRRLIKEATLSVARLSSHMPSAHTSHLYNQLLLTCPLMMTTQRPQTTTMIFHTSSFNLYPATCSYPWSGPRRTSSLGITSYQMAYAGLVPWQHVRME